MHRKIVGFGTTFVTTLTLLLPESGFAAPPPVTSLTPNQASLANYLKTACAGLTDQGGNLSAGQTDLLSQCQFFTGPDSPPAAVTSGYSQIIGQQINALGPQTKKFGSLQQDNISARLSELRHDSTWASISGLTVLTDDGQVLAGGTLGDYLPIGASGDESRFLDGKLGVFVNGTLQSGLKPKSKNSFDFDIKDDSLTVGADYRVGSHFVFGAAYGTGLTSSDFGNLGRVDLRARGVDVYASFYADTFYVDLLAGYGVPKLETDRHIQYTDADGAAVSQDARAGTDLHELWTGISTGRPFAWGAFSVTPQGSLNFHEVRIPKFSETLTDPTGPGAGLGLTYGEGVVPSLQGRAGLRTTYTVSSPWGIFEPNLHADWVREFRNHSDAFTVQFENAPTSDTGAYTLKTDVPEGHYMAYGGGFAFQFAHAISGYADYEELKTLKAIKSHEFTLGVRIQL